MAEPHRFADDGFGDRHPTLAVELHPAEPFGDQEAGLEVRVGDVFTDVCVIEARRAAWRCLCASAVLAFGVPAAARLPLPVVLVHRSGGGADGGLAARAVGHSHPIVVFVPAELAAGLVVGFGGGNADAVADQPVELAASRACAADRRWRAPR